MSGRWVNRAPEDWTRMGKDYASPLDLSDDVERALTEVPGFAAWHMGHEQEKARSTWAGRIKDWRHARKVSEQGIDAEAASFAIEHEIVGSGIARRATFDVAGGVVDIGRYMTGAPDCMVRRLPQPRPLMVSLGVQICASASVPPETLRARGEALFSAVQAIEATGARVRLDVVMTTEASEAKGFVHTSIRLKDYGAPVDTQVIAYWLAHPSGLRWWMFAAQAAVAYRDFPRHASPFCSYQGMPTNPPAGYCAEQWDVYFEGVTGEIEIESPEEITKRALEAARARREAGR